jgi:hypothetical protein
MSDHTEKDLEDFIDDLDTVIMKYEGVFDAHNVSAMLLSRVLMLQTMDPATGKELLKYVWQQLDEIEQADPGNLL